MSIPKQQINWAAPTTVLKRCPAFAVPKDPDAPKELTKGEKDRMALAAALVLQARARQAQDEGGPGQSLALTGCKPDSRITALGSAEIYLQLPPISAGGLCSRKATESFPGESLGS
jgi:hypothetical protein